MTSLVVRRVLLFLPTLFAASVFIFALRLLIPGGTAEALAGPEASSAQIAQVAHEFGLDRPLYEQYVSWVAGLLHGNLGVSYGTGEEVSQVIAQRIAPTLELVVCAFIVALVAGVSLGLAGAIGRAGPAGSGVAVLTRVGLAVPDFWVATICAGVFGLSLGWVPAVGYVPVSEGLAANLHSVILPILVLAVASGSLIARHVASAFGASLSGQYVRAAWAMGLRPREVYFRCALPNALGPVITFLPIVIAGLVGASIVVENVFAIPGLGNEIVQAVNSRDYAVLQDVVILLTVLVLVLNLLADIAMTLIDPRVKAAA